MLWFWWWLRRPSGCGFQAFANWSSPIETLILVRHTESLHHIQDLTGGWTDTDLTERGGHQAQLLAVRLRRELAGKRVVLLSSDLRRAVQTAAIIGQELGISGHSVSELRDINNGEAAGMTRRQAQAIGAPPSEPFVDWIPYPDAESWRQFSKRVVGFLEGFIPLLQQPAILVTHGLVVRVTVQWWLGMDLDHPVHFGADPGSLTVLRTSRWQERSLERLNDTAHLYADGLSLPLHI